MGPDGAWSDRGASFAFTLRPFFWETVWFWLLVGLSGVGVGTAVYRTRMRWLERRREALQAEVDARTRDLRAALDEREVLLREIHHRVKNNLQTVASLLRLQSRRVQDPAARAALTESVRRVGSIAVVHEMLAETSDEDVDLDDVLARLTSMVSDVATSDHLVEIRRSGRAGRVSAAVATPVAMAVTELLQNAIQHGLQDRSGVVSVSSVRGDDAVTVTVDDDGRGLPAGFDVDASDSLGLRIVTTVVQDRGGAVTLSARASGTRAHVWVPLR
jgi:two-component sensor histidine kinase